jgi:hypothetical protein
LAHVVAIKSSFRNQQNDVTDANDGGINGDDAKYGC